MSVRLFCLPLTINPYARPAFPSHCTNAVYDGGDDGGRGIDGPDGVASSRIVGALASIIFPTPHQIQNDDRLPRLRCEWVTVSSGTGQPG